ncbi:MAG: aldo/keto reductase [Candidatus Thorarchaeota archaeon]
MDIKTTVTLNNQIKMPIFGLGTYNLRGRAAVSALHEAFQNGYRLLDTATFYGNEREIGQAIRTSEIPREEFFVTTKLWNSDHGFRKTLKAFDRSLQLLQLDYIDLYLIHWPVTDKRKESWRALESLYETNQIQAIGVSNYMIHHLQELFQDCVIRPTVNQIEFHPFHYRKDLLSYCKHHSIEVEAYSPLTKGHRLHDPRLGSIAAKYSKTPAQLLIRWGLQHDVIVIPKSGNPKRIRENSEVFDFVISNEDMEALDTLNIRYISSWDPTDTP